VTVRNVLHNFHGTLPEPGRVRFYAGDWLALSKMLLDGAATGDPWFDVILTAETIYTSESTRKVRSCRVSTQRCRLPPSISDDDDDGPCPCTV